MKKILTIIAIIILLIGAAAAAWFFFFASDAQKQQVGNIISFGQSPNVTDTTTQAGSGFDSAGDTTGDTMTQGKLPRLYQLHKTAIAGLEPFEKGGDVMVRYIEKGLGHIYETDLATLTETRISNETINAIYDAQWDNDGSAVAFRSFNDTAGSISTYTMTLAAAPQTGTTTTGGNGVSLEGVFLPLDVVSYTTNAAVPGRLFYLHKTDSGVVGTISSFKGASRSQIFSSPFVEWSANWPEKNTISLLTHPSSGVVGDLYLLDVKTDRVKKILGDVEGLTALVSPAIDTVVYSESNRFGIQTNLYDVLTQSSSQFPVTTLPEKCVWSQDGLTIYCAVPENIPGGSYPDDWYQGLVSFDDSIWKIDIENGTNERILSLSTPAGTGIDATHLTLGPNGKTLFFINKKDGTPWRLLLEDPSLDSQQISAKATQSI